MDLYATVGTLPDVAHVVNPFNLTTVILIFTGYHQAFYVTIQDTMDTIPLVIEVLLAISTPIGEDV